MAAMTCMCALLKAQNQSLLRANERLLTDNRKLKIENGTFRLLVGQMKALRSRELSESSETESESEEDDSHAVDPMDVDSQAPETPENTEESSAAKEAVKLEEGDQDRSKSASLSDDNDEENRDSNNSNLTLKGSWKCTGCQNNIRGSRYHRLRHIATHINYKLSCPFDGCDTLLSLAGMLYWHIPGHHKIKCSKLTTTQKDRLESERVKCFENSKKFERKFFPEKNICEDFNAKSGIQKKCSPSESAGVKRRNDRLKPQKRLAQSSDDDAEMTRNETHPLNGNLKLEEADHDVPATSTRRRSGRLASQKRHDQRMEAFESSEDEIDFVLPKTENEEDGDLQHHDEATTSSRRRSGRLASRMSLQGQRERSENSDIAEGDAKVPKNKTSFNCKLETSDDENNASDNDHEDYGLDDSLWKRSGVWKCAECMTRIRGGRYHRLKHIATHKHIKMGCSIENCNPCYNLKRGKLTLIEKEHLASERSKFSAKAKAFERHFFPQKNLAQIFKQKNEICKKCSARVTSANGQIDHVAGHLQLKIDCPLDGCERQYCLTEIYAHLRRVHEQSSYELEGGVHEKMKKLRKDFQRAVDDVKDEYF